MSTSERLTREQIEEVLYTYSDVIPAVVAARFRDLLYQSALDSDNAVSGRESYRAGYSDGVAGVPPLWPLLGMPARSDNAARQVPPTERRGPEDSSVEADATRRELIEAPPSDGRQGDTYGHRIQVSRSATNASRTGANPVPAAPDFNQEVNLHADTIAERYDAAAPEPGLVEELERCSSEIWDSLPDGESGVLEITVSVAKLSSYVDALTDAIDAIRALDSDNAVGQVPLQITAQQSVSDNAAYGPIQQHPGGQPYRVGVSTGATAPPIEILRAARRSAESRSGVWTQEEIDAAHHEAKKLTEGLNIEEAPRYKAHQRGEGEGMTVIEAIVIWTTGWSDETKKQYDEACTVIYETRSEINRRMMPAPEPKDIKWFPRPRGEEG